MQRWDGQQQGERQNVNISKIGTSSDTRKTLSIDRGNATLMVNAAIMDDHNEPVNAPWLVELELPVTQ